jgi:two-component system, cell cycle sensor histidine kinase and response regulator CckA
MGVREMQGIHLTHLRSRRTTVLVVADDLAVLTMIRGSLMAGGCRVLVANTSEGALRLLCRDDLRINVALLDVGASEGPGELAGALSSVRPNIRLLYVSGSVDEEFVRIQLLDERAWFQPKPFGPDGLPGAVREALQKPATLASGAATAHTTTMSVCAMI